MSSVEQTQQRPLPPIPPQAVFKKELNEVLKRGPQMGAPDVRQPSLGGLETTRRASRKTGLFLRKHDSLKRLSLDAIEETHVKKLLSNKQLHEGRIFYKNVQIMFLEELKKKHPELKAKLEVPQERILRERAAIVDLVHTTPEGEDTRPLTDEERKAFKLKNRNKALFEQLKRLGISKKEIKTLYLDVRKEHLNNQSQWQEPIQHAFCFKRGRPPLPYKALVRVQAANQVLKEIYANRAPGVCAWDPKVKNRARNAWIGRIDVKSSKETASLGFVRHGVICTKVQGGKKAQRIKEQADSNNEKAKELLTLSVIQKLDLVDSNGNARYTPAQLDAKLKAYSNQHPFKLLSLSLLSAFKMPNIGGMNEKNMLEQQWSALATLSGEQSLELPVKKRGKRYATQPVKLHVNSQSTNFAVNQPAMRKPIAKAMRIHEYTQQHNALALENLFGKRFLDANTPITRLESLDANSWVGEWLRSTPEGPKHQEKKQAVLGLIQDAHKLWHTKDYTRMNDPNGDPYKMHVTLGLVADAIGGAMLFNCKSGKDRTGHMANDLTFAFCKNASAKNASQRYHYDVQREEEDHKLLAQASYNSGSHEIQALNTGGITGSKGSGFLKKHLGQAHAYITGHFNMT